MIRPIEAAKRLQARIRAGWAKLGLKLGREARRWVARGTAAKFRKARRYRRNDKMIQEGARIPKAFRQYARRHGSGIRRLLMEYAKYPHAGRLDHGADRAKRRAEDTKIAREAVAKWRAKHPAVANAWRDAGDGLAFALHAKRAPPRNA